MNGLPLFLVARPRLLDSIGRLLVNAAFVLALSGLLAMTIKSLSSSVLGMAKIGPKTLVIADLYPSLPTWWIPESAAGLALIVVLFGLGAWMTSTARMLYRTYAL